MARQTTAGKKTHSGPRKRSGSSRGDTRSASEKPEKYRFAQNTEGGITAAESTYRAYATDADQAEDGGGDPDVLVDVPVVKVDSIHLEVEDLDAQVSLKTEVLELLDIDVGANVHLGKLRVDIKGVEAQALLKVRLDHVTAIVDRVMTTLDRNPELVESLGRALEQVGQGAADTLGGAGSAVDEIGEGTEGALDDIGAGAGEAVGELGSGANAVLGDIGEGAGQAVGDVGEGAGQAVGDVGEGAGEAAGSVGRGVGGVVSDPGQVLGQVLGAGNGNGGAGDLPVDPGDLLDKEGHLTTKSVAKAAAKSMVKELGSAATEEAREIGQAAKQKVRELGGGEGEEPSEAAETAANATPAARRVADELGVPLGDVVGSGPDGRVMVADVRNASEGS